MIMFFFSFFFQRLIFAKKLRKKLILLKKRRKFVFFSIIMEKERFLALFSVYTAGMLNTKSIYSYTLHFSFAITDFENRSVFFY